MSLTITESSVYDIVSVTTDHATGYFGAGETIDVTVDFRTPVSVGPPVLLSLNIVPDGIATYTGPVTSAVDSIVVTYTTVAGDKSLGSLSTTQEGLSVSGDGYIRIGSSDADLTIPCEDDYGIVGILAGLYIDDVGPTITVSSCSSGYGKVGSTFDCSLYSTDSITSISASANTTAMSFSSSGDYLYNFTHTFTSGETEGVLTINFSATDTQTQTTTGSYLTSYIFDKTAPTAPSKPTVITGGSGLGVTITGGTDTISGISSYLALVLSGGTLVSTETLSGSGNYHYFPEGDGTYTCAAQAVDCAGNISASSTVSDNVIVYVERPTCILTSSAATTGTIDSASVTATFSVAVSGLDTDKIITTNSAYSSGSSPSSTEYLLTLTALRDGSFSIYIDDEFALSPTGTYTQASNTLTFNHKKSRPLCDLGYIGGFVNTDPFYVPVYFSEGVIGFSNSAVLTTGLSTTGVAVTGGIVNCVIGEGQDYLISVSPSGEGLISITVVDGACTDVYGNNNKASSTLEVTYVVASVESTVYVIGGTHW